MVAAGKLKHRVTIQKTVTTANDYGENEITRWADVVSLWASIRPLSAREQYSEDKVEHKSTHLFVFRFTDILNSKHRINYRGRAYHIDGIIDPTECREELHVTAHEISEGGNVNG